MEKIKVCHIITKLELGGAQQNTLYTVNALNKDLFETILITGKGGILDPAASSSPWVTLHFVPTLVREISPLEDLYTVFTLWRLLRREKPAIVHTHSSKAGILGRWAAYLAGIPVIIHTFHGFGFNDFQNRIKKYLFILLERITASITDSFIAVSQQNITKGTQCKIGIIDKYTLIRSGIETKKYKNAAVDKTEGKKNLNLNVTYKVITTIGPFKPQKNLFDFIRVAKKVSDINPHVIFLVVGDGMLRSALEKEIAVLKVQNIVQLLGWRRDVHDVLAASDVFVMTSLWEGLPRSILEAMCTGLPVVANAVDGVSEVVVEGENGYLIEPFNTEKMAERILLLLHDDVLAHSFGQKGKALIDSQYDINYMVQQQEQLYHNLLRKTGYLAR